MNDQLVKLYDLGEQDGPRRQPVCHVFSRLQACLAARRVSIKVAAKHPDAKVVL
jgi:hypothetical protein